MIGGVNVSGAGYAENIDSATIRVRAGYGDEVIASCGNKKIRQTVGHKLPSEYTEVGYIESQNGAYIDAGLMLQQGWKVDVTFMISTAAGTNTEQTVLGMWAADSDSFRIAKSSSGSWHSASAVTDGTVAYSSTYAVNKTVRAIGTVSKTPSLSCCFFAQTEPTVYAHNVGKTRIQGCDVYDSTGKKVKEYVPCYKNSPYTVGFYEMFSGTFYSNSNSSGSFAVGAVYPDIYGETVFNIRKTGRWKLETTFSDVYIVKFVDIVNDGDYVYKDLTYFIPDTLQEVEYLQCGTTDSMWFDTGIVPSNHQVEEKVLSGNGQLRMFGENYNNIGAQNFHAAKYRDKIYAGIIDGTEVTFGYGIDGTILEVIYNYGDSHKVYSNGEEVLASATSITNHSGSMSTMTILKSVTYSNLQVGTRLYYVNVFDRSTGKYVRRMRPCRSKTGYQVGLYDCVSKTLYINQATGTIVVGDDVL